MKQYLLKKGKKLLLITAGSLVYAAGIALFLEPNNLAPGGVSGLSIIMHELVGPVSTGTWILIFNVPLLLLGIYKFGLQFFLSTIYAVAVSSAAVNLFSAYVGKLTGDVLLACIAGSVLVSAGLGIVFRAGATTGGSDIVVKLLRLKFRHINTGTAFLLIDSAVVVLSGFVFGGLSIALYAEIAVFLQMFVLNAVLYGSDEARLVYVISEKKDAIAHKLLHELEVGVTFLEGKGAYTGDEKQVLLCALRMRSLPKVRDIVAKEDEKAFMIVTKATAVFGEGFKSHHEKEL